MLFMKSHDEMSTKLLISPVPKVKVYSSRSILLTSKFVRFSHILSRFFPPIFEFNKKKLFKLVTAIPFANVRGNLDLLDLFPFSTPTSSSGPFL